MQNVLFPMSVWIIETYYFFPLMLDVSKQTIYKLHETRYYLKS